MENGNVDAVKRLLSCDGINKNDLGEYFKSATIKGHEAVIAFLLSVENIGCDLCLNEALAEGLKAGSMQCIKHLVLDKRTNINFQHEASYALPSMKLSFEDHPGFSSIHPHPLVNQSFGIGTISHCSRCNNIFTTSNTSLECSVQGRSCFILCSPCSSEIAAKISGISINGIIKDHSSTSILIDFIVHGHSDVTTSLLTREDLDVNAQDDDGNNALIFAACQLNDSSLLSTGTILDKLLSLPSIDVNHVNKEGYTALCYASCNNVVEKVKRYFII